MVAKFAVGVGLLLSMGLAVPAHADVTTVYMTNKESCGYQCTVAMMQIDGSRVRVTINQSQANGYGSIGWLTRRGDRLRGWMGIGDCYKDREVLKVEGRGANTRLKGMTVRSRAQAQAFVNRHPNLGLFVPTRPIWTSMKDWNRSYAYYCEGR